MEYPYNWTVETPRLMYYPGQGEPEEIHFEEELLYLGEVEDMNAAVLEGAPNYLALEESRNHIRTVVALYASARAGRPVPV